MKICTFAGHREAHAAGVTERINEALETILQTDAEFCFYTGGMGEFDRLCAAAVRRAKREHPNCKIELVLVLPYLTESLNANKKYYESEFDGILVPMELMGVHYKGAIQKRNRWMVDQSDYLLAYIRRDFGGAFETWKYAKRKADLVILNIAENGG